MATIGSLAVQLSANSSQFNKDLDSAEKRWKSFGAMVSTPFRGAAGAINLPTAAVQGFLGPIQQLATSLPFIGTSLASLAGAGGFTVMLKEQSGKILEMARNADKLGMTYAQLAGMKLAAGPAAENIVPTMARLERQLGLVAIGSKAAEKTFEQFGMQGKELAKLPMAEAFGKIADKLNAMPHGEKMAAGIQLFGRGFHEILPLIDKGSEGIEKAAEKAKEWGLSLDSTDTAKIRAQASAFREIEQRIEGIKNQWAVAFAPAITAQTQNLTAGGGVMASLGRGLAKINEDVMVSYNAVFDAVEQRIKNLPITEFGAGRRAQGTLNRLDAADPVTQKAKAEADAKSAATATQIIAINDLEKHLDGLIATEGMGAEAAKIWQFEQDGATEADLRRVRSTLALKQEQDDLFKTIMGSVSAGTIFEQHTEKVNKLALAFPLATEAAAQLNRELEKKVEMAAVKAIDNAMEPLDRLDEKMRELGKLAEMGKITEKQLGLNILKLVEDAEKAAGLHRNPEAPGLEAGSAAAAAAVAKAANEAMVGDSQKDVAVRLEQLTKVLIEKADKQNQLAADLLRAFTNMKKANLSR